MAKNKGSKSWVRSKWFLFAYTFFALSAGFFALQIFAFFIGNMKKIFKNPLNTIAELFPDIIYISLGLGLFVSISLFIIWSVKGLLPK